jgi:hypothetical protein
MWLIPGFPARPLAGWPIEAFGNDTFSVIALRGMGPLSLLPSEVSFPYLLRTDL